jgi:cold shock CspA family protein
MTVKYQEATRADDPNRKCAVNVCSLNDEPISYFEQQGERDNFQRVQVSPGVRYKGVVKNYFFRRKFGWIQPEDDDAEERRFLAKDIYVARQDIKSKTFPPGLRAGTKIEFELYEDDRGLGACNVTGPDGALIENTSLRQDFENKVFSGTIEKFRLHGYLFIKPDQNLKEYGVWNQDVHGDCESINTEQRPARVTEKLKVTFKLMRDKNGFHAVDINDEEGNPIKVDPEETSEEQTPHDRQVYDDVFSGRIRSFSWSKGSGWIEGKDLTPELQSKTTHREGLIYFYRKDIISKDKVFGVHENVNVKFQCYIDDKGIGACNITDENGDPIQDMKRPSESNSDSVQHGIVNYYDRQKRLCHIRYKGKVYAVSRKNILVLREAEHLLRRGTRVEFLVERWRGRTFLKQVSFPDRRAKPKDTNTEKEEPQNAYSNYQTNQPLFNPYQPGYMPQTSFPPMFDQFFGDHARGPPPHQQGGFPQFPGQMPYGRPGPGPQYNQSYI